MTKYRKIQNELDDAEERVDVAETQVNKLKIRTREQVTKVVTSMVSHQSTCQSVNQSISHLVYHLFYQYCFLIHSNICLSFPDCGVIV